MSSERPSASRRPARPPITPRVAAGLNATPTAKIVGTRPSPTVRAEPLTPRVKAATTPLSNAISAGTVTPRSSARSSRVESATSTPTNNGTPTAPRSKSIASAAPVAAVSGKTGLGISNNGPARAQSARPKSLVSESGRGMRIERSPVRSPAPQLPSDNNMFFHASDAPKQVEPVQKVPEVKKPAAFFYADGQQEAGVPSPVLSAVSDQKSTGPWIRPNLIASPPGSPPILSPGLSSLSNASPFFPPAVTGSTQRSNPPGKENIHLSYRKGASQIFGTRPAASPRSTGSSADISLDTDRGQSRGSSDPLGGNARRHHKSPSLSSIDSGSSPPVRRRSATNAEVEPSPSPLAHEVPAVPVVPRLSQPTPGLRSIDTSLEASGVRSPEGPLSPSKGISDFAAEARRERKVQDLEISNNSLLAINSSLEREIRRQKTELKRFRRLSRAGRFSFAPGDWSSGRQSDGLSVVGEEDENGDGSMFGPASGLSEMYDDMSDDDDESLASSAEPLSPSGQSNRERDRLAKDEKRLRVDLEKHKELLVQSQAMNQSIKRCMYATEDMIREGRKALEYHVRVSDIKLGGRVLSSHEDDDEFSREIEVVDDHHDDGVDQAKGFLDVWGGIGRPSFEGSEGGDRDSGIEVDRIPYAATVPLGSRAGSIADSGRPPGTTAGDQAALSPGLS